MVKVLFPELPRDGRRRKMGDLFDTGHVAQLHEIQKARLKNGEPGIGREVEELIRRLTSGGVAGKSNDLRTIQAKRLWDLGVGRELGFPSFGRELGFEKYLETIPAISPRLLLPDRKFPLLVLVEPRLPLKMLCALANVDFHGDNSTFVPRSDEYLDVVVPVWIRIQGGRKNRNRSVEDCRRDFAKNERGLTALEGVSAYIHHPEVVTDLTQRDGHAMDLPGSVRREEREDVARLSMSNGRAMLDSRWDGGALPDHGSASHRKVA